MTAVAHTSYGALRGDACGSGACGAVVVFRGVPYAAAPTVERRWRPLQPAASWAGVRETVAFGPIPPQDISPERLAKRGLTMSEDCLTLNIWTPAVDDNRQPCWSSCTVAGRRRGTAPLRCSTDHDSPGAAT